MAQVMLTTRDTRKQLTRRELGVYEPWTILFLSDKGVGWVYGEGGKVAEDPLSVLRHFG